ncbi:MAG: chemotaxis protein CheA, partial [Clostridiales bacterium]|nr:chemotaxis protein CheA [Clostridiales bacterium]
MATKFENEPMLEIYIFETTQILDQLEQVVLSSEKTGSFSENSINEIFRFMHTIKGSSAMMLFNNITNISHQMEEVFYFIREKKPQVVNHSSLSDLVLSAVDFIKVEVNKIKNFDMPDGNPDEIIELFKDYLAYIKEINEVREDFKKPESTKKQQYYIPQEKKNRDKHSNMFKATIHFDTGCEMENIRAYTVIFSLTEFVDEIIYEPADIAENDETSKWIRENGFQIHLKTSSSYEEIEELLNKTVFLSKLELTTAEETDFERTAKEIEVQDKPVIKSPLNEIEAKEQASNVPQSMISVHVDKLDGLMNMVGELVIAEAMVTQNPIVASIESESFLKASRLLHKITGELQDMVMSIRMVPLSTTFIKMHRIVRDMSKKLQKNVVLELSGEETEVDKNIIEHISDPLMHLIRNALDHGIESENERRESGKELTGKISLSAKNAGSDVLIIIKDDGKGLSKENILRKAREIGLLFKPEEDMTEREIFNLILFPGFSTKADVTEFSGRGVGMDVVAKNLEAVGGVVIVESEEGVGTTITLKIPLTLAIIEGMNIKVGQSRYTIPITTIKESFRPSLKDCIMDPDNNEMVMVRGNCYPIMRLHERYDVKEAVTGFEDGIMIMVEQDERVI